MLCENLLLTRKDQQGARPVLVVVCDGSYYNKIIPRHYLCEQQKLLLLLKQFRRGPMKKLLHLAIPKSSHPVIQPYESCSFTLLDSSVQHIPNIITLIRNTPLSYVWVFIG